MKPPSGFLWMVDIIFLIESKGASPTRSYVFLSSPFGIPAFRASLTRAHSVGSPTASLSSSSASQQRAIPFIRKVSSAEECSTTVILFCVSVPVLSEQIICVQPSVSTAVSFLIMAWFFDILVTPMESRIVTTAASPSGIAATARDTATINVSSTSSPFTPAPVIMLLAILTQNTSTQIPITIRVRILES